MRRYRSVLTLLLLIGCGIAAHAQAPRPTHEGLTCFFGTLHSHSVLSGDFRPQPLARNALASLLAGTDEARFRIENGPMAAWKHADVFSGIDFLALTDHLQGPLEGDPDPSRDEMPPGGYRLLVEAAQRINTNPLLKGRFLAIPGIEWGANSRGNHVNILFARKPVPDNIPNGNFKRLLEEYLDHPDFERSNPLLLVQMNHPNQGRFSINYGRSDFPGDEAAWVKTFRPGFVGIEHINSSSNGGNENDLELNAHREGEDLESHFKRYLNLGFRLAPVGDHDNHRPNWGRHTAARTGVWARELTPEGFVEAYRARRVFATEDNEMAVVFMTGDQWMGSEVPVPAGGETRTFTVRVDQMTDTDLNVVQNEGPYFVELFGDLEVGGDDKAKRVRVTHDGTLKSRIRVDQGATVQFTHTVKPGGYYYLHVQEENSKDANGSEAEAWTAPIWFVARE